MASRKETTCEVRKLVIKLHNETHSLRSISRTIGRPVSTVQGIVDRYGINRNVENKKRSGRPSVLSERNERQILREVKTNPKISASKIATKLIDTTNTLVSKETVRRHLNKQGYYGRVARRKCFVNEVNRKKRLEFAQKYRNKTENFWNQFIFTDESKFNLFGSDGRCKVWRQKNKEYDKKNVCATVKHFGGNVMVWGCMSASGVGNLVIVEDTMDQYKYIEILKNNLQASANKMGLGRNYIFQQDNDPKHSSLNAKLWILYNTPEYCKTPPQSPDVNPIEHLWDELERRIRLQNISSLSHLREVLQTEWALITPDVTKKLVQSMPKRLEEIIKSNGNPTKY